MSIDKRGNVWWIDVTINDKRIRKSLRTTDKKVALLREKEIEQALWRGTFIEQKKSSKTLQEAYKDLYLLHWARTKDAKGVQSRFDTLLRFIPGTTEVAAIDRDCVDNLIKAMRQATYTRSLQADAKKYPYADATINRVLALLGFILNQMVDRKVLQFAPKMPKTAEQKRTRFLTEEEENKMFDALASHPNPNWYRSLGLFEFLVDTGCRLGEARGLLWQDYSPTDNEVLLRDTKSGKDVVKPLTARAKAVLEYEKKLGVSQPFAGITQTIYLAAWNYAKKAAGLEDDRTVVRHTLRHTAASRMIQRGVSLVGIKEVLGHESSLTTQRYTHLSRQNRRAAVEVLEGYQKRTHSVT